MALSFTSFEIPSSIANQVKKPTVTAAPKTTAALTISPSVNSTSSTSSRGSATDWAKEYGTGGLSYASLSDWKPAGVAGPKGSFSVGGASNVANFIPTYVPPHKITGIPGYTAPSSTPRSSSNSEFGIGEITPRIPGTVYNPPSSNPPTYTPPTGFPTGYPTGYPTGTPTGTPTSYPSGGDLNQLSQTMAMMVAPQQSQAVVIGGDRSQLLPFQADRAFRGKDPGISQTKNRNYLDMLRAGFSS